MEQHFFTTIEVGSEVGLWAEDAGIERELHTKAGDAAAEFRPLWSGFGCASLSSRGQDRGRRDHIASGAAKAALYMERKMVHSMTSCPYIMNSL
jgi:hypothetical protein